MKLSKVAPVSPKHIFSFKGEESKSTIIYYSGNTTGSTPSKKTIYKKMSFVKHIQ